MPIIGFSQEKSTPRQFFDNLKKHAGKAYEGTVTSGACITTIPLATHQLHIEKPVQLSQVLIDYFLS